MYHFLASGVVGQASAVKEKSRDRMFTDSHHGKLQKDLTEEVRHH